MEQIIRGMIFIHAFFGGLGLITGIISVLSRKGGFYHKKIGKIFSFSMILSSLISLFISSLPNHKNLFLFIIGIFTIYLILSGKSALMLKSNLQTKPNLQDYLLSGVMFLVSFIMIIHGIIGKVQNVDSSILYLFFGGIGAFLTLGDFHNFRVLTQNKNIRLASHLGRMTGALIASVTAFLVAGLNIATIWGWVMPTILGTFYIIFWNIRIKSKNNVKFEN